MSKNTSQLKRQLRSQLRGHELEKRIEFVIREIANEMNKMGKEYVFNSTKVAALVPTTRKTLSKYDVLIDRIIGELKSRRRMSNGNATLELMQDRISHLQQTLQEQEKIINELRMHHVEIYRRFHAESLNAENLIRPILETECNEAGQCIFCKTSLENAQELVRKSNVIDIANRFGK